MVPEGESIMVGEAWKQKTRARSWEITPQPLRGSRKRLGSGVSLWTLKVHPSDTSSSKVTSHKCSITSPTKHYHLGAKCSDTWVYGGYSHSDHHRALHQWSWFNSLGLNTKWKHDYEKGSCAEGGEWWEVGYEARVIRMQGTHIWKF